ncbi:amidinotransferase [Polaribacter reichenbachii]|uniref:Amidinotransferase n=1 Tax=Polaribacter reichenbachii TaxID=996801 RepID=A0A1B8TW38_9FLAO|nr:arginine deiminase-related protein [Polaribacter reichenbachii]APZ45028.1 amidinotransferase [Polaribacter reichenbachii]AUC18891.1 amidinotransferase [Polaribacter reichenbachii]OBY63951.1 amidinotransferase [Polaribacter reichenbachii]
MQQTTNTILMVRPVNFRMNEQTAVNNYYQEEIDLKSAEINKQAQKEFDDYVDTLRSFGVNVVVVSDNKDFDTPDSIFPNNWISFHADGTVAIYPMFAENRRLERREDVLEELEKQGFFIDNIVDYTSAEEDNLFLEGTGSMILDRENKKAYCALSPRADEELFIEFCEDFEYTPVVFIANQTVNNTREAIYHTNVMMCVAETFAVVCLSSIDDKKERKNLLKHLKEDKKQVIDITEEQVTHFAGNMLQVRGKEDERFLVMSQAANNCLTDSQRAKINNHCKIISSSLHTIETCGGGSARCMMAEVFLPKEKK